MPYEVTILAQLSAIDTEDDAVTLANRVQETVTNSLFTASGIPSDDLVVSLGSFIEYDADTGEYIRILHPHQLSFEEAQQEIIRIGVDRTSRGGTKDLD